MRVGARDVGLEVLRLEHTQDVPLLRVELLLLAHSAHLVEGLARGAERRRHAATAVRGRKANVRRVLVVARVALAGVGKIDNVLHLAGIPRILTPGQLQQLEGRPGCSHPLSKIPGRS